MTPVEIPLTTPQFDAFLASRVPCPECWGDAGKTIDTIPEGLCSTCGAVAAHCTGRVVASRVVAAFDAVPTVEVLEFETADGRWLDDFDADEHPLMTGDSRSRFVPFVSGDAVLIEQMKCGECDRVTPYMGLHLGPCGKWNKGFMGGREAEVAIEAIVTRHKVLRWPLNGGLGSGSVWYWDHRTDENNRVTQTGNIYLHADLFDALPSGDWVALMKP